MDRSYTKRMYTMEQLKTHGAKLYRAMERASLNITFFPPKNIYVEGDAACMTCPYKVVSRNPRIPYVERGIYYTEFSKGGTGWRISLTEWQIEYCNDAKWQEYKRKHENQNHLGNPRYLQPEAETVKREATLESRSIHIQR